MKSTTTGTVFGCIVCIIVVLVIGGCLLPLGSFISGFTPGSALTVRTVSPMVCPKGTTGQHYSYDTTTPDGNGFPQPAIGHELHCLDANGNIVKNDPYLFGLVWEGPAARVLVP